MPAAIVVVKRSSSSSDEQVRAASHDRYTAIFIRGSWKDLSRRREIAVVPRNIFSIGRACPTLFHLHYEVFRVRNVRQFRQAASRETKQRANFRNDGGISLMVGSFFPLWI